MDELTYKQEIEVAKRMWDRIVVTDLKACVPLRKEGLHIACLSLAASENTDGYAIAKELHDEYGWRPNAALVAVLDEYDSMYEEALEEARDVIRQAAFEESMEDKRRRIDAMARREQSFEDLAEIGRRFEEAMQGKKQREKALEEIAKFDVENDLI